MLAGSRGPTLAGMAMAPREQTICAAKASRARAPLSSAESATDARGGHPGPGSHPGTPGPRWPLARSFWYVGALARAGYLEEARLAFEKMLTHANHVGLYAGQISRAGQRQGNFIRR